MVIVVEVVLLVLVMVTVNGSDSERCLSHVHTKIKKCAKFHLNFLNEILWKKFISQSFCRNAVMIMATPCPTKSKDKYGTSNEKGIV